MRNKAMSNVLCKEGLDFIQRDFPDFPETDDQKLITLAAIAIGIKESKTLHSEAQEFMSQLDTKHLQIMCNDLSLDNAMAMIENPNAMNLGMFAMTSLDNESNITGQETSGQPRVKTVANNTKNNAHENLITTFAFQEYAQFSLKAQTEAHAYYGDVIDTNFDNRKDKKEISDIIDERPLDVIALGIIAKKSREVGLSSCIFDAQDLTEKLNLNEVKTLSSQLNTVFLKDSIEKADNNSKPFPGLTQNKSSYNRQTTSNREYG